MEESYRSGAVLRRLSVESRKADLSFPQNYPRRQRRRRDDYLTTIVRETLKAGLSSAFNGFRKVQRSWVFSLKTVQPLKTQHFIRLHLKTPTVDIAPVKLYPYVKSKTQTQMHEFASCFCPYRLYPHDTLCTYGVKQFASGVFPCYFSASQKTRKNAQ